jgi:hypothetical protein
MRSGPWRALVAVSAVVLVGYVLTQTPVILSEATWPPLALPILRSVFGILLLFRLERSRRWPRLMWPAPLGVIRVEHVLVVWQVLALALVVGFATPIAAALCLACEVCVFHRTYTRSLEDVLFQTITFFLIFVGAGQALSVDVSLGIAHLDPFDHLLARNLWWLAMALIMFSAGFEKLFSPLWQRGLGFNYFIGLPHLVQRPFRFLRRFERFGRMLSWVTVIAELALLPMAVFTPGRFVVTFVLIGFAMGLFLIVDLSFIGQVTLLVLVLFGVGDGLTLLERVPHATAPLLEPRDPLLYVVCALYAIWVIALFDVPFGPLRSAAQWITRVTIGVNPNKVFTEVQLYGIYLYRIVAECQDGTERVLVRTFQDDGSQGPMQRWHPRMFLKFTYEVTDYCLRHRRDGVEVAQATMHFSAIKALLQSAFDELTAAGQSANRLVLYVRAIDADDNAPTHEGRFQLSEWVALLEGRIANGTLAAPTQLAEPPPIKRTSRLVA